jgi:hypothetical protein
MRFHTSSLSDSNGALRLGPEIRGVQQPMQFTSIAPRWALSYDTLQPVDPFQRMPQYRSSAHAPPDRYSNTQTDLLDVRADFLRLFI